jgi:membrane-bound serine protease (ClpP class)
LASLLVLLLLTALPSPAQQRSVYVIEITGEVDLGLTPYVTRIFEQAKEDHAAAVVLHINTFGGRVDVATDVRDAILGSGIPTIAYVDRRAISAGALIALSARQIAMAPGGSMGAATPVYQTGEKASEKVVSYMRGEMRATAEKNGRDPRIAEAMVDESVTLPDSTVKLPGKLLTLTTEEALRLHYCDVEAATLDDALARLGYRDVKIVRTELEWGEHLVRFFTSPVVNSILIMLGLGGIIYGVKTGHFGGLASIGIVSMALFFGAQYLADLTNIVEVVMFVVGIGLIALEVFVIPGFGITGVLGFVMVVASLFLALIGNFNLVSLDSLAVPLYTLIAAFLGLGILVALMVRYLPHSSAFGRLVLQSAEPSSKGYLSVPDYHALLGATGQTLTTLRPAGIALLDGQRVDVVTEGDYIPSGEHVVVVRIEGRKIVVRRAVPLAGPGIAS